MLQRHVTSLQSEKVDDRLATAADTMCFIVGIGEFASDEAH
jgi:hypothetical protein